MRKLKTLEKFTMFDPLYGARLEEIMVVGML